MKMKRVAIIGAGVSGLTSAKHSLENGLVPVVFEKSSNLGGLWGSKTAIWEGLSSNLSYFSETLINHPWPPNTKMFPTASDIYDYLISYVKRFDLEKHVHLKNEVKSVNQLKPDNNWQLEILDIDKNELRTEIFDYLIVASGAYSFPHVPKFENAHKFTGIQIHSSQFRKNDPLLKDKNVAIIGCSHSASDISELLVDHCKTIVNIFRRPYLIVSRLVRNKIKDNQYHITSLDQARYKRSETYPSKDLSPEEAKLRKNKFFENICPLQTRKELLAHNDLYVDLENDDILISICDNYIDYVSKGKITPKKSNIKQLEENGILLEDGSFIQTDVIIYCTGYKLDSANLLDEGIIQLLKYDDNNIKYPFVLYKYTFHPDIQNLALVGQTKGLNFTGMELQSKWAAMVFAGKANLPSRKEMHEDIAKDDIKRRKNCQAQFPNGGHVTLVDNVAQKMGLLPDFDELRKKDPDMYNKYWNGLVVSANFFLQDNKELAIKLMDDVTEIIDRVYEVDDWPPYVRYEELAYQISKYYKI